MNTLLNFYRFKSVTMDNIQFLELKPVSICLLYTEGTDPLNENRTLFMNFQIIGEYGASILNHWFFCFDQKKRQILSGQPFSPEDYFKSGDRERVKRWNMPPANFKGSLIEDIYHGRNHKIILEAEPFNRLLSMNSQDSKHIHDINLNLEYLRGEKKVTHSVKPRVT